MDLLQGALAFAVAMILFSTVVSGISETLLRAFNQRPANVRRMLAVFIDRELSARLRVAAEHAYPQLKDDGEWQAFLDNLVALLTDNPVATAAVRLSRAQKQTEGQHRNRRWNEMGAVNRLPPGTAPVMAPAAAPPEDVRPNANIAPDVAITPALPGRVDPVLTDNSVGVETLSTYAFLQRLAKTEVGQIIVGLDSHDRQRALLQDMARTYERYVAAANEAYRKRGRFVAMGVAIIVAVAFNISAWRLFSHLMDSPEAREDLIARAEMAVEANTSAEKDLSRLLLALEEPDIAKRAAELTELNPDFESLEDVVTDLKSDLDPILSDVSLPIGPSYFPYSAETWESGVVDTLGSAPFRWEALLWLGNVLLAGVLIGLGGPFWYRVFSSLSHLTQVLRMVRGGGHSEVMGTDAADQPATKYAFREATSAAEGGERYGDVVTVFYTAAGRTPPKVVDGERVETRP